MPITSNDIDKIIELSKSHKQSEIAKLYGVSQAKISNLLKEKGIKRVRKRLNLSRLNVDFDYFDNIDSEKKAYWLGFIVADGCLKSGKLRVVSKDLEVLEKLKFDLKSDHAITKNKSIHKKTKKEYVSYVLQITNSAFTDKLSRLIPINKSEYFAIPNIEKKYYSYFIAGMMDGDGSFSVNKNGVVKVSLISTIECLQQIQEYLIDTLGIKKTTLQNVSKGKNVWKLFIYSKSKEFLNFIYSDSNKSIYLQRKQEKLKNIIY